MPTIEELSPSADIRTPEGLVVAIAEAAPRSGTREMRPCVAHAERRSELLPESDNARAVLHRALKRAVNQNRVVQAEQVHTARAKGDVMGFMNAGVKDRKTIAKALAANAAADGAGTLARQLAILPTRFAGLLINARTTAAERAGIGTGRAVAHVYTVPFVSDVIDPLTAAAKRYGAPAPIKASDDLPAIAHNARLVSDTLKQALDRGVTLSKPLRDEYTELHRVLDHYARQGSLAQTAFGLAMLGEVLKQAGDWVTAATTATQDPIVGASLKAASALVIYPVIDAVTSAIHAYQTMDYHTLHADVVRQDGSLDEDALRRLWVSHDQAQDEVIDKILSNHVEKDLREAHIAQLEAALLRQQAQAPTRHGQTLLREKAHHLARAEFLAGEIYQLRPLVGKADGAAVRHLSFLLDKYEQRRQALDEAGGSAEAHAELDRFKDEIQAQAHQAAGAIQRELSKHRSVPGGERLATRDLLGELAFNQVARLAEFAGIDDEHAAPNRHGATASALTTLGVAVGQERLVGLERQLARALRRIEFLDGTIAQDAAREAAPADRLGPAEHQILIDHATALEASSAKALVHARQKLSDIEAYRLATVALTASRRAYIAAADSDRDPAERTRLNEHAGALDALGNDLLATIRPDGQFAKLVTSQAKRCFKDMGARMRQPLRLINLLDARHPLANALVPALAVGYSGVGNLHASSGFVAQVPSVATDVATLGALHLAIDQLVHDRAAARNARSDAATVSYLPTASAPPAAASSEGVDAFAPTEQAANPLRPAHGPSRDRLLEILQSMPRDIQVDHLIADANEAVGKSVSQYSRLLVPRLPLARQGLTPARMGDFLQRGVVDPLRAPAAAVGHAMRRGPIGAAGAAVSVLRTDPIKWAAGVAKRIVQFLEHAAMYAPSVVRGAMVDAPALHRLRRDPDVGKLGFAAAVGTSVARNLVDPPFLQPVSGLAAGAKTLAEGRGARESLKAAGYSSLGENTSAHKIARRLREMERLAASGQAVPAVQTEVAGELLPEAGAQATSDDPNEQVTRF